MGNKSDTQGTDGEDSIFGEAISYGGKGGFAEYTGSTDPGSSSPGQGGELPYIPYQVISSTFISAGNSASGVGNSSDSSKEYSAGLSIYENYGTGGGSRYSATHGYCKISSQN